MNSDALIVQFRNPTHRHLHEVLVSSGFCFEVTPDNIVGVHYRHSVKRIEVELQTDDNGEYRATTFDLTKDIGQQVNAEQCYTMLEWEWLESAEDEADFLKRELHVLLRVRPAPMIRQPLKY